MCSEHHKLVIERHKGQSVFKVRGTVVLEPPLRDTLRQKALCEQPLLFLGLPDKTGTPKAMLVIFEGGEDQNLVCSSCTPSGQAKVEA